MVEQHGDRPPSSPTQDRKPRTRDFTRTDVPKDGEHAGDKSSISSAPVGDFLRNSDAIKNRDHVNVFRQEILAIHREVSSSLADATTLKAMNTLCDKLSQAEESLEKDQRLDKGQKKDLTDEIIELQKKVEHQRLDISRKIYQDRYYSEIHPLNDDDKAVDKFGFDRGGAAFVRTEVKDIKQEYLATEYYKKDEDGADTEYPNREDAPVNFEHACYRNYYFENGSETVREDGSIKQESTYCATENWGDRDKEKKEGERLPNSELIINQVLDAVGGDRSRLKIDSLIRCIVSNTQSREVVGGLVAMNETKNFDPESKEGKELLSIPNCLSAPFMAKQYRWLLGDKKVGEIKVHRYFDDAETGYGYGDVSDISIKLADRS